MRRIAFRTDRVTVRAILAILAHLGEPIAPISMVGPSPPWDSPQPAPAYIRPAHRGGARRPVVDRRLREIAGRRVDSGNFAAAS